MSFLKSLKGYLTYLKISKNNEEKKCVYIYSEGLSGCGSNAGYNNKNILINCNPNFNDENDDDSVGDDNDSEDERRR